jgi:glutaredoxin
MMRTRIISALLLTLLATSAAAQQIYRWTDEKGRVHITDTPPPASAKGVEKKAYRSSSSDGGPPGQTSYELTQATKDFPVTLYTAPSCDEPCDDARAALNRRGVPFKEVLVADGRSAEELKRVSGGEQVPVLVVGRSVHSGFLQGAYDSLLDAARYPKTGAVPPRAQAQPTPGEPVQKQAEEPRPTGPYAPGAPPQRTQKK